MTIEQAKIEIAELQPVVDKLQQKCDETKRTHQMACADWSGTYEKLKDLKAFVRVSEATCQ